MEYSTQQENTPSYQVHLQSSPTQTIFWGTKPNFKFFLKIKVMQHNETKLEINNRKRLRKPPNSWKLNNIRINAQGSEGKGRSKGT